MTRIATMTSSRALEPTLGGKSEGSKPQAKFEEGFRVVLQPKGA